MRNIARLCFLFFAQVAVTVGGFASTLDGFVLRNQAPVDLPPEGIKSENEIVLMHNGKHEHWVVSGTVLKNSASTPGGFMIRDAVSTDSLVLPIEMKAVPQGKMLILEGESSELNVRLKARFERVEKAFRISGSIKDLAQHDRSLTLYYTIPFSRQGMQRLEDSKPINDSRLIVVANDQTAVGLGLPEGAMPFRMGYSADAELVYLAMDYKFEETAKPSRQYDFSFAVMAADPKSGFDSALKRFQSISFGTTGDSKPVNP